jgi:hypothetical protein
MAQSRRWSLGPTLDLESDRSRCFSHRDELDSRPIARDVINKINNRGRHVGGPNPPGSVNVRVCVCMIIDECSRKMVNFCAIVGCNNRADKHKGVGFYRLPAIISHQGEQTYGLTCKRRDLWLSRIHREDLGSSKYPYVRVCSRHFKSGKLN